MDFAQKSVLIKNKKEFVFRLEVDDIKGIIRLTRNTVTKSGETRITERNVPINVYTKWKFHSDRHGYSERSSDRYNFVGSYIDREKGPVRYNKWEKFVYNRYKELANENKESNIEEDIF